LSEKRFVEGFPTGTDSKALSTSQALSTRPPSFEIAWPRLERRVRSEEFGERRKELEMRMLKEMKEKALLIEKEAYEKGFAQGERDGLELAEKRLETAMGHLQNLIVAIGEERQKLFKTYEKEMVAMVLSIAKRIIRSELTTREDVIVATLREAFKQAIDQGKVVVHLHPLDYLYLSNHSEGLPVRAQDRAGVTLVEDPSVTRGGCLLETSYGEIDATFEGQFDQIASAVWEKVKGLEGMGCPP